MDGDLRLGATDRGKITLTRDSTHRLYAEAADPAVEGILSTVKEIRETH